MLLRYRGMTYETATSVNPQSFVPEPMLTYRGVSYQPNWAPKAPIQALACYRGVPYKFNGETVPSAEKLENPLITVALLKETHHFSMGSY